MKLSALKDCLDLLTNIHIACCLLHTVQAEVCPGNARVAVPVRKLLCFAYVVMKSQKSFLNENKRM